MAWDAIDDNWIKFAILAKQTGLPNLTHTKLGLDGTMSFVDTSSLHARALHQEVKLIICLVGIDLGL